MEKSPLRPNYVSIFQFLFLCFSWFISSFNLAFYLLFKGYHRLAKYLASMDSCYSSLFLDQFWRNFGEQPSKRDEGVVYTVVFLILFALSFLTGSLSNIP